jgi:hypothetical protein
MNELVHTFEADTCPQVWLQAAEFLMRQKTRSAYNVVLAAHTPELLTATDFGVHNCVDEFLGEHGRFPVATVAGTIFPANFYMHRGAKGLYKDYLALSPRIPSRWDHYAIRMLRRSVASDGREINPLRVLVDKMKRQFAGWHMRAVYEMNMIEAGDILELPLYDATTDSRHTRGQLCLIHLSFKLLSQERQVALTALYRHHYYVEKALGNLIGLAQLLSFVAAEVGVGVGPLICHSTLAELDEGSWGVHSIQELLDECRRVEGGKP